jgi:hypothetical protein
MDYENSAYKYMYGETPIMMSLRTFWKKQKQKVTNLPFGLKMETRLVFKKP